jgi:hypothetical protein
MVPLLDVSEASGGLEVIPNSHTPIATKMFKEDHPQYDRGEFASDWCPLRRRRPEYPAPILLMAKAGDLILWDSRTLHGGRVGNARATSKNEGQETVSANSGRNIVDLARLAVTVCMTPKSLASQGILAARRNAYKKGCTFTHWPHEAIMTAMWPSTSGVPYSPVELPEHMQDLIS